MRVFSHEQAKLLRRLVGYAGSNAVLERALSRAGAKAGRSTLPNLDQVLASIAEVKEELSSPAP